MAVELSVDAAIIGAGFGGSLTALLLHRIGLRTVLLDRGSHPRFAIGESSTPIADLVLRDLARRYDLPRMEALSRYGTWKAAFPDLMCGLKRGFSYFHHRPNAVFTPQIDHANELIVAASGDDAHADTHWLRSDVDAFLTREAQRAGVPYFDRTQLAVEQARPSWRLRGRRDGEPVQIESRLLIDASGEGGFLTRALGIGNRAGEMKTHSRAIFAHFADVAPWREFLVEQRGRVQDHPFPCDCAALHQVLEEGWMWQLRFDNGVTSAGVALDARGRLLDAGLSPEAEWERLLERYPSIAAQFARARVVQPAGGLQRTGRLQRRAERIAGQHWLLLPHTAGFID
ncbi:MAG: FAD-dependent oxidoreductase, partial [Planctomycetes bacterium]|nr:FAD-dependent oxidoreductase [Planctomycetota bacterium]